MKAIFLRSSQDGDRHTYWGILASKLNFDIFWKKTIQRFVLSIPIGEIFALRGAGNDWGAGIISEW